MKGEDVREILLKKWNELGGLNYSCIHVICATNILSLLGKLDALHNVECIIHFAFCDDM